MKLRDHPLTCHQNAPSWPPVWVCVTTGGTSVLTGEVGTLIRASMHDLHECRISLRMQNGEHEYVGHLLIDDSDFCLEVCRVLQQHIREPITAIGDLDFDVAIKATSE